MEGDLPDHFTAELVLGAGEMRQTVSFDVQTDQKPIIKPSKSVTISDGIQASVDALKNCRVRCLYPCYMGI